MTRNALPRRKMLVAGASALAGAAGFCGETSAQASRPLTVTNEETVRKYYKTWEKKDWSTFEILLADSFTFTSANDDDHISKSAFKARCWETQSDSIERFELERLVVDTNEAFVKYLCRTTNGKSFRNVEYLRLRDNKVAAIECYFGGQSSFASAVAKGNSNAE